jgi:hypothetical protein
VNRDGNPSPNAPSGENLGSSPECDTIHTPLHPTGRPFPLTLSLINACRTAKGGFTAATMRAFGLNFTDAKHGWVWRLVGKQITQADYQMALAGRFTFGSTAKEKNRRLANHAEFNFAGSIPSTGPTKARS